MPELESSKGNKPDGTIRDALRMARGYWEAKDPHDSLDAEIQAKFSQGYPRDNILFEDSREEVLFQNGAEAMRVQMTDADRLHRLIERFPGLRAAGDRGVPAGAAAVQSRPAVGAGEPAAGGGRGRGGQRGLPGKVWSGSSSCATAALAQAFPRPTSGRCCCSTS